MNVSSRILPMLLGYAALLVPSGALLASDDTNPNTLTDESYQSLITQLTNLIPKSIVGPSTYGIPSGFGLGKGQGYVSGSITNHRTEDQEAASEEFDGSYALGIGLSDPNQRLGVDVNLGILSSTPGDQTEAGNFSIKVHKQGPNPYGLFALSAGANNVAPWGDPEAIKTSYYVAASQMMRQTYTTAVLPDIMISGGVSDGAKNGGRDPGVYLGIGAKYTGKTSVSVGWAGDEIITGLSFQPTLTQPIIVSAGLADAINQNDDRRLLLSVTYAIDGLF